MKLFRHKRGAILEAFGGVIQGGTRGTKEQFREVLGGMLIYPGDEDFDVLWARHDPNQRGTVDYEAFLHRFIMSVSGGLTDNTTAGHY